MAHRIFDIINLCILSVTTGILLNGCGDTPAAPTAAKGGENLPAPLVPADATPVAEEAVLKLDSEHGPASLTVRLRDGIKPSAPWRPEWPAVKGPFTATSGKNEYTAPVDVDYATVRRWDTSPLPPDEMRYWESRFAKPQPYSLVPLPKTPQWPLKLTYDAAHRVRQLPFPFPIVAEKSLLLTMTDVVNNPQLTWEPSNPSVGNRDGAWTFHHLMSAIANESVTGVAPGTLVRNWLQSLTVPQYPDGPSGGVAPARNAELINTVLSCWPKLKGTDMLDTSQSPFRLLAIVNRLDLRLSTAWGNINNHRAELRFVFCYVEQQGQPEPGMQRDFLAIVEFGVPLNNFTGVRNYALKWANLSRPGLSSVDLCAKLSFITEDIVQAYAAPGRPNGSNLNHLRTEDMYFAPQGQPWDMREFILDAGSHQFKTNPLNMTPDFSWADPDSPNTVYYSTTMRKWIQANSPVILSGLYELPYQIDVTTPSGTSPKRLRGAVALDGYQNWFSFPTTQPCSAETRLAFIRNTCNGCHSSGNWTPENEPTWSFAFMRQINGRPAAAPATLSDFLNDTDLPRRLELLRSIVEADPILPIGEFFQHQVTTVD